MFYLVERYTPSLRAELVADAVRRVCALAVPGLDHIWTVLIPSEDT
jgi:hypothetical protein